MTPGWRLFLSTFGLLWFLKLVILARCGAKPSLPYLLLWPGMDPTPFLSERHTDSPQAIEPRAFLKGWMRMIVGLACVIGIALGSHRLSDLLIGWVGIAALLLMIHLGVAEVLPWLLRWCGWNVGPLFDRPWAAKSLDEFWTRRWNLAFVEMNRLLFLKSLRNVLGKRRAIAGAFVISGVLHEAAISFPAGGGWGGPLTYFVLQAVLVQIRALRGSRILTWIALVAPAPMLFHTPFRSQIVVPFYRWLGSALVAQDLLSWALIAAGLGHFLVLVASLQVPSRLGWYEDIPKLSRFNQKIFWVYGAFILFCIVGFGVLTLTFRQELIEASPVARGLAAFIAMFWTIRILTDIFWYDHTDWPPGDALVAGHALLTTLFICLAGVYWTVALW